MSHDSQVSDPLSRAIGEFREELLFWIDAELSRLRREQAENLVIQEELATAGASPLKDEALSPVANPRQRLDALARLLDHRLKQAKTAGERKGGAGQGANSRAEDHTPEPSRLEGCR
jgi:hypothetical protein